MNDLNEALKRYEPKNIEEAPPMLEEVLFIVPRSKSDNSRRSGAVAGWLYDGFICTPGIGYSPEPGVFWLPLPSLDRPDPRNEALRIAWEALAFYAQPTETIKGDDPDEPDWPIVVHQWPGNDGGEKAREAQAAILKALEGG